MVGWKQAHNTVPTHFTTTHFMLKAILKATDLIHVHLALNPAQLYQPFSNPTLSYESDEALV